MNMYIKDKFNISILGLIFISIAYYLYLILGAFYASEFSYALVNLFIYLLFPIIFVCTFKYLNKKIMFSYFLLFVFTLIMLMSGKSYSMDYYDFLRFFSYFGSGLLFFIFLRDFKGNLNIFLNLFFLLISLSTLNFDPAVLDYLYYADSYVLLSFLLLCLGKNIYQYLYIFILSLVSLYFINSRSALFFFVGSFGVFIFYIYGVRRSLILLIPIFLSLILFIYYLYEYTDTTGNRILRIIFSREEDTSLSERNVINSYGENIINNNFFTGHFGAYRDVFGYGKYIHNYLSFISEYGFFGLVFILFMYFCFFKSIFLIFYEKYSKIIYKKEFKFVLLVSVYAILGITLTKSYRWFYLYFSFGFCISFLSVYSKGFYKVLSK